MEAVGEVATGAAVSGPASTVSGKGTVEKIVDMSNPSHPMPSSSTLMVEDAIDSSYRYSNAGSVIVSDKSGDRDNEERKDLKPARNQMFGQW